MAELDTDIEDSEFWLIFTETKQLNTLDDLTPLLSTSELIHVKRKSLTGDFNLFFNFTLETKGGNPSLKRRSLRKLIEIKETWDVCDIWKIRNCKVKNFTFR